MTSPPLTSRQHPVVQRCRRISAGRGEPGSVLLDGTHLIEDALQAGVPVDVILASVPLAPTLAALVHDREVSVQAVTPSVIEAASPVRSPSGVVAIASWTPREADSLLSGADTRVIGLAGVQDPGNVGNMIRSADALGATGVMCLDGTADPSGWKALRGAMGSTFRLPIGSGNSAAVIDRARALGVRVAATVAAGGAAPDLVSWAPPTLVLIGSEGAGLPTPLVDAADVRITVPMRAGVESLNAATTAALILWEMTRNLRSQGASA